MFDYIQKFKGLPKEVYEKLSDAKATSVIDRLEKEYSVSLAKLVMLVAIREVELSKLENYISGEFNLDLEKAKKLSQALKSELFSSIAGYLEVKNGLAAEVKGQEVEKPKVPAIAVKPAEPASEKIFKPLLPPGPKSLEIKKAEASLPKPSQTAAPALAQKAPVTREPKKEEVLTPKPALAAAPKPPSAYKAAPFFFSAEDEEEIGSLSSKVSGYLKDSLVQSDIQSIIETVAKEYGSNFSSDEAVGRLKQILRTYLQGIRDKLEAKLTLMKGYQSGGLGIDERLAMDIIAMAEKGKNGGAGGGNEEAPKETSKPSIFPPAMRDLDYNLKAELEKRKEEIAKIIGKKETPEAPVTKEKAQRIDEELAKALSAKAEKTQIVKAPLEEPATTPAAIKVTNEAKKPALDRAMGDNGMPIIRPETNGRRKIEDVKFTPKILTPIEELRYLDLNNFRRLYKVDPIEATNKLKEKIGLLEEEEYAKKLSGIKAWRQSPLVGLYLEMGHESIMNKKSMVDIIELRKKDGRNYLTENELNSIMDFNRELRF